MTTEALPTAVGTDWHRRFRGFSWAVVVFTIGVVVSGDIVQATESGAGCGESWPRCDGSLVPAIGDAHTAVEFTHRIATTVLSLGFIALLYGAWKLYGRGHRVWGATLWATFFLMTEILLGAALVLFGWVDDDASWGRVAADGLHVVNTFLLVGGTVLIAWFASGAPAFRIDRARRTDRLLVGSLIAVLLIAVTGTINSLADTLALSDQIDVDETPIAAILVNIRGIHPAVAIGGGIGIFYVMTVLRDAASGTTMRLLIGVQVVIGLQFVVGILNIALLTPLETQIIHLVLADTIWILLILLTAQMLRRDAQPAGVSARPRVVAG
jgi:cytochrome c oxidase assembly protein subunit 15